MKKKKIPKFVNKFRRRTSLQSLARAKVNQLRDCVKRETKGDLSIVSIIIHDPQSDPRGCWRGCDTQHSSVLVPWGAILVYSLCGIWSRAASINGAVSGSAGTSIKSMKSKTATAQSSRKIGRERGSSGESFRRSADDFCGWPNVFIVTLFGYQKAKQKRKQRQKQIRKTEQNVNN